MEGERPSATSGPRSAALPPCPAAIPPQLPARPGGGFPHWRTASSPHRPSVPAHRTAEPPRRARREDRTEAARSHRSRGGDASLGRGTAAGFHLKRPGSPLPPPSPRLPLPLLPAAGRTNPLGPGCKSNLVPRAPPPLPQSPVTAENGQSTFPPNPHLHATMEAEGERDGTAIWRIQPQ